jgi:type II pantothenate kinase
MSLHDAGMCFGFDIGGTLAKFIFFQSDTEHSETNDIVNFLTSSDSYGSSGVRDSSHSFHCEELGGTFHFLRFESRRTPNAVALIKTNDLHKHITRIYATGGGAHKFAQLFKDELGITLQPEDELATVMRGLCFLRSVDSSECYSFDNLDEGVDAMVEVPHSDASFPMIVCNIGSGVSILKANSESDFKRVSGTALGGATFWGLARLLTKLQKFDDALDCAHEGDASKVNMLVRDIYGGDYGKIGLPGDFTACFFGKAVSKDDPWEGINSEDVSKGLLVMISQNITQIAYLIAQLHGVKQVRSEELCFRRQIVCARSCALSFMLSVHSPLS